MSTKNVEHSRILVILALI